MCVCACSFRFRVKCRFRFRYNSEIQMHMTSDRRPWITDLGPRTADIGQLGSTAEFLPNTIRVLCRGNSLIVGPKPTIGFYKGSKIGLQNRHRGDKAWIHNFFITYLLRETGHFRK